MFGKKLTKGFLVDSTGNLVKEFIFSSKADVSFEMIRPAIQGRGDVGSIPPFEVAKSVATIVKGDKMHFVALTKGAPDMEDLGFFREILNSVELSLGNAIESRIKTAEEAEARAKKEQEAAKKASDDTLVISIMLPEDTRKMKSGADPSAFQFYRYGFSTVGEQDKSSGGAREMVSWEQLLGQVRAAVAAKQERVVRIDADRRVPYGLVAQLIDHLQLYKLPKVGLRTLD